MAKILGSANHELKYLRTLTQLVDQDSTEPYTDPTDWLNIIILPDISFQQTMLKTVKTV